MKTRRDGLLVSEQTASLRHNVTFLYKHGRVLSSAAFKIIFSKNHYKNRNQFRGKLL